MGSEKANDKESVRDRKGDGVKGWISFFATYEQVNGSLWRNELIPISSLGKRGKKEKKKEGEGVRGGMTI